MLHWGMWKFVKKSKENPNTWHSGFKNLDNHHETKQLSVAMPLLPNQTTPNKINNPETKPAIQTGAWFFSSFFFQNFQYQTFGKNFQTFRKIHLIYTRKNQTFPKCSQFYIQKSQKNSEKKSLGHTGASCKALYTYAGNGHWECIETKKKLFRDWIKWGP